jgi:hypothetical protein
VYSALWTAASTRGGSRLTRPMGRGDSFTLMATFMKATGSMIRLRGMGYILIKMEVNMRGSFIWTSRRAKGLRYGLMERNILENTKMERKMEEDYSSG